ncbi:GNAT family N-acetyltransferase [Timonella sp. A28]|uniref:GNAT family N-acetyltransferase n=1 Tax=Timonella sp. A28 TaxID=3442640 RepID=UPI003EBB0DD8
MQHEIVLEGYGFRLEPLSQAHVGALAEIVDPHMWAGMSTPTPHGEVGMANYIEDALSTSDVLPFAVVDTVNGEIVGSTAFNGVHEEQGRVEIGRTFYARSLWGRVVNPVCKFLLMEYAFEQWGMYRIAMRADSRNARSISAITRLGATYEGTLRGFRIAPDGTRCDSVSFSILQPEWPTVRDGLLNRIDPLRNVSDIHWPNTGTLFEKRTGDLVSDGAPEE